MHYLSSFRYCPVCGSSAFQTNDVKSKRCADCGFTLYLNASAATAAFIVNSKKELLVCRRALQPAKGTLDLPGGFVDPGESVTEGMLREIKEELGVDATISRFLFSYSNWYRYSDFDIPTADVFFEAELKDESSIKAGDDCSDVYWIPLSQIDPTLFGLKSIRNAVMQYLSDFTP